MTEKEIRDMKKRLDYLEYTLRFINDWIDESYKMWGKWPMPKELRDRLKKAKANN